MHLFNFLRIEHTPDNQVIALLQQNVIGTPGKSMLYRHHNVAEKLRYVPGAHYANLSIRNRLYGTICLSRRQVYNSRKARVAYYLRYFTFRENVRSSNSEGKQGNSRGKIRREVHRLMDGEGLEFADELLLYAYVDSQNVRSKRLIDEYGFHVAGQFNVISYSRLFPARSKRMEIADTSQEGVIRSSLREYYRDFQLMTFDHLFKHGSYFYITMDDEMVCGVQAHTDQWDIEEMPGFGGKLLMYLVPKVPLLNRIFNPAYRFVMLELAFCNRGHENLLSELFESVLNYYKLNSGILCIDPRSKLYNSVQRIDLGLAHRLQGEKQIDIAVKASKKDLIDPRLPFAVSGFDVL